MGAWQHTGGRSYTAQCQFFGYTPFGAPDRTPDGTLLQGLGNDPARCGRYRIHQLQHRSGGRHRGQCARANLRNPNSDAAAIVDLGVGVVSERRRA